MANQDRGEAIRFTHVTKAFGALVANRDLSFSIGMGSIHGIIGENGAGKSTAMKMLYGMQAPDSGQIFVHGEAVAFRSPRDAMARGIGMVHQHFMLAGALSAWENLILGQEPVVPWQRFLPGPWRQIDRRAARARIEATATLLGAHFDWDAPVAQLPVSAQQKLEVMKLLLGHARILILDEPTAVLTPLEAQDLFRILARLRDNGHTIIIITHKLKEVMAITDRVTVMRHGTVVAERDTAATHVEELGTLMMGRRLRMHDAPVHTATGERSVVLDLRDVHLAPQQGKTRLDGITLAVEGGEILGIAGVQGSGQKALLDLIAEPKRYFRPYRRFHEGVKLLAAGKMTFAGRDVRGFDNHAMRAAGMGFVAEDRHSESLLLDADLCENFLLGHQDAPSFKRRGMVAGRHLEKSVHDALETYDVRPRSPRAVMRSLSGGNQQKLIMARELWATPRLLIAAEPTRGVDINAIEAIHCKIRAARHRGAGILLVSSDLDELMNLADRILVMCDGRLVRTFARHEFSEAAIGIAMGGGQHA